MHPRLPRLFLAALLAFVSVQPVLAATTRRPVAKPSSRIVTNFADRKAANPDDNVFTGRVTAKTDTSITVGTQLVLIMTTTVITRGGTAIRVADISLGDTARVTTLKGVGGSIQAATVEMLVE